MNVWDAEIAVDERLVRRLLRRFAEVELESIEHVAEGWDRSAWLVDGRWLFGFPRRAVVVPGIEHELEVLPRLAPLVPLPIPVPVFVGEPDDEYPWPFFGSAYLPGVEADETTLVERRAAALDLARFLRALHRHEAWDAVEAERLPLDANARADMGVRVPRARAALAAIGVGGFENVLAEAERLPPSSRVALVHGDLHARQILVDGTRVSGVIDWVDVGRADPAVDLQLLWSFVDPHDRADFVAEYGRVTGEQLLRARVVAISLCAILVRYARDVGNASLEATMLAGLERAASD